MDKKLRKIRQKYSTKKVLNRDREIFKAFSKCHKLNQQHLDKMNFSKASMERYIQTGTIERVEYFDKHSQSTQEYFKLTDYGKGWCNRSVFEEKQSFYSSTGISHDLRIADVYTTLIDQYGYGGFEWKSEREIQQDYRDRLEEIRQQDPSRYDELRQQTHSAPDFAYKVEETTEYVEVITGSGSYSQSHLEAKTNFTEVLDGQCQFIR